MSLYIRIRFNFWQRLRVLFGQRVHILCENDPGKHEEWVAWGMLNGYITDALPSQQLANGN